MDSKDNFSVQLLQALDNKSAWLDSVALPKLLENYRLHSSCVRNISDTLVKKSLITPDPYKHDKKISGIVCPESTEFSEGDRSSVIGLRLSDYDSMLDFLCNYFKFSVSNLDNSKISKLMNLNNTFLWNSFSLNSPKANTRGLASLIAHAKTGADPLTVSLLNDSVAKSAKAITEINKTLTELADFQKEMYKGQIRKNVFEHPAFDRENAFKSAQNLTAQIKKTIPAVLGKKSFNAELVAELVAEEFENDKEERRKKVLDKLRVVEEKKVKKQNQVNTKDLLMDTISVIGALSPQLTSIIEKIKGNHSILESEHNSLFDKIKIIFRKAFNLQEPPVIYEVLEIDQATHAKRKVAIDYNDFIANLERRNRVYTSFNSKKSPGYQRVYNIAEDKILDFIKKQLAECQALSIQLAALDEYFKTKPSAQNKVRIRGIKIDLTAMKNTLIKINQRRADYVAYIEEQAQMKKLGITDAD